jgi:hypothetical protein
MFSFIGYLTVLYIGLWASILNYWKNPLFFTGSKKEKKKYILQHMILKRPNGICDSRNNLYTQSTFTFS